MGRSWIGSLAWLMACGPQVAVDDDATTLTATTGETGPPDPSVPAEATTTDADGGVDDADDGHHDLLPPDPDAPPLDVLFVIDNSATMADAQLALGQTLSGFVGDLATNGAPRSVQLMVTTTDVGNPLCTPFQPQGYEPAKGAPTSTGCNERIGHFTGLGASPDVREDVCTSACPVDVEPNAPFIAFDTATGVNNVDDQLGADGLASAQAALSCVLPQGINGCGYEAPLEAMIRALNPDAEWNEGDAPFVRDDAELVIVLISDETDCSVAKPSMMEDPAFQNVNPDNGNQQASSAICWNAGTTCDGPDADGIFHDCTNTAAPLHPVSRYGDVLADLRDDGKQVAMVAIGGVPTGGRGDLIYRDWQPSDVLPSEAMSGVTADDLRFDYGIGPGCVVTEGPELRGLPSPRVFEVCDGLAEGCCIASICDGYTAALACLTDFSAG